MRNSFVHDLSEVPGWDLSTEEGIKVAWEFLIELAALAVTVTGVFMTLFTVSARERFGAELIEGNRQMSLLEEHFGPTARKILAGRYRKPVLVHSKTPTRA
jgi:hypothetical protein